MQDKQSKEIKAIVLIKLVRKVVIAIVVVISLALIAKYILNDHLWLACFYAFFLIVIVGIIEILFSSWQSKKNIEIGRAILSQMRCPKCNSNRIKIVSSGLWDGIDEQGKDVNGTEAFGICPQCKVKLRSFDDEDWQEISEKEWKEEGLTGDVTSID